MADRGRLLAAERAAVAAWPALETAQIGRWLWRFSNGGSRRANSVSCLDSPGAEVDRAIAEAEARYRACGVAASFQVGDVCEPADLGERLRARGYTDHDPCTTLGIDLPSPVAMPSDAELTLRMTEAWLAVYTSTLTPDRARTNPLILARIPEPCAFVSVRRGGDVVGCTLAVVSGDTAVVECVGTVASARRQGVARDAVQAALSYAHAQGARRAALSALATNMPAQALYSQLGFTQWGRYSVFVKDHTT